MSTPILQVIAHYYAKPETKDDVARLLNELAEHTRNEPKNLSYHVFRSIEDDGRFLILEEYSDEHGLDEHRETEHFQNIGVKQIIPMLEKREVQSTMVTPSA